MHPQRELDTDGVIICPVCDELVPIDAVSCRHCGASLVDGLADPDTGAKIAGKDAVPELDCDTRDVSAHGAGDGGPFSGNLGLGPRILDDSSDDLDAVDRGQREEPPPSPVTGKSAAGNAATANPVSSVEPAVNAPFDVPRAERVVDVESAPAATAPGWNDDEFARIAKTDNYGREAEASPRTSFEPWPEPLAAGGKPPRVQTGSVQLAAVLLGLVALAVIGVLLFFGPFELKGPSATTEIPSKMSAIETPIVPAAAALPSLVTTGSGAAPTPAVPGDRTLGDRTQGDRALGGPQMPLGSDPQRLSRGEPGAPVARPEPSGNQLVAHAQSLLARRGYYQGRVDGQDGPQTRRAVLAFQAENGLPRTGRVDNTVLRALERRPYARHFGHSSSSYTWETLSRDR